MVVGVVNFKVGLVGGCLINRLGSLVFITFDVISPAVIKT